MNGFSQVSPCFTHFDWSVEQVSVPEHVPQEPPQPSSPHTLPAQSATQLDVMLNVYAPSLVAPE